MPQGRERRIHPRREVQFSLRFRETRDTLPYFRNVLVKDLSRGGMRFQVSKFISREADILMEFVLPKSRKPIHAMSKVAWSKSLPAGEQYEIGSRFTELAPLEKALLDDYLALLMEDPEASIA
jgi:hypothetical protein